MQIGCFEQGVHYRFFGLFADAALNFAANVFLHFFTHFGNVAVFNTQSFSEICVNFRQSSFRNVVQSDGEYGRFTGNIFTVVVFREVYGNIFAFTGFHTDNTGFEFRQHLTCTQYESVVFRCAASERFAVDFAFKVDDDAVAVLCFAFNMVEAGALFTQDFYSLVNFGIANSRSNFFYFLGRQVANSYFRENFKNSGNFERLLIVLFFNGFKAWVTGNFQFLSDGNFVEFALYQFVDNVVLCACAVHLGNHFERCFTRTEAVNFCTALGLFQFFLSFCVDFGPRQRQYYFAFQIF